MILRIIIIIVVIHSPLSIIQFPLSFLNSPFSILHAQGFSWEWPPRAPFTMPTRFVGMDLGTGYVQHYTNADYSEGVITCCSFGSGAGVPLRIAVLGESWVAAKTAVSAAVGLTVSAASFTAAGDTLPMRSGQLLTEYTYDASLSYLSIEGGVRQRLFNSLFSAGFVVRGLFAVSQSERLYERVLSPDDYYFTGNPPARERELTSNLKTEFAPFVLETALNLQYDVPMGFGYYIAPSFTIGVPVTSIRTDATWRYLWVGFGFKLMRGI